MGNEVLVPTAILERLKATLTSAFYYSQALDLQDSYRQLGNDVKWSRMTTVLSQNIELVQTFLDIAAEEAKEEEVDAEEVTVDAESGDVE